MNKSDANTLFSFASASPADSFSNECALYQQGYKAVGGVDEAGRGPLAGPVVAACVVLPPDDINNYQYKDSKKLSSRQREELYAALLNSGACCGLGMADPRKIEEINILQASLLAMKRAVQDCCEKGKIRIDFLLVDGKFQVSLPLSQQALIKGESKSASIAAASILAKVTRDRIMADYHSQFPQYNFLQNQGYPTAAHKKAIEIHGPSTIHRKTFKGVREHCGSASGAPIEAPSLWQDEK